MEEVTGAIFNDSMHNYGRAGADLGHAFEGVVHVVQGVWDASTGVIGAGLRAAWGTTELVGAGLTALPELAIDGIGSAWDNAVDSAVAQRVAPECRVDSSANPETLAQHQRVDAQRTEGTYTVQPGDSLWKIATADYRHNHGGLVDNKEIMETVAQLRSTYGERIHPGMEIRIPRDHQSA